MRMSWVTVQCVEILRSCREQREAQCRHHCLRLPAAKRSAMRAGKRSRGKCACRVLTVPEAKKARDQSPLQFSSRKLGRPFSFFSSARPVPRVAQSSRNKSQGRVERNSRTPLAQRPAEAAEKRGCLWQGGGVCSASFLGNRGSSIRLQGARGSSQVFPNDPRRCCCGQIASDRREAAIAGLRHRVRRDQQAAAADAPWMHDWPSRRRRRIKCSHLSQTRKG